MIEWIVSSSVLIVLVLLLRRLLPCRPARSETITDRPRPIIRGAACLLVPVHRASSFFMPSSSPSTVRGNMGNTFAMVS